MKNAVAGALLASCMSVAAQTPICQEMDLQIRNAEMELAANFADGIADNSAPRETNRQLRASNLWASIQVHLRLMQEQKCTLPNRAISAATYMSNALACATERMRGNASPEACKRSNWKPATKGESS